MCIPIHRTDGTHLSLRRQVARVYKVYCLYMRTERRGDDGISQKELDLLIATEKARLKFMAAAIAANARATGADPQKALLKHGSVRIYKASNIGSKNKLT